MTGRTLLRLGVLLSALILVWLGISFSNSLKQKQVSKLWSKEFPSLESFPDRFPTISANHPALELERLSAQIGIDLAPKALANRTHPTIKQQKAWKQISKEIKERLNSGLTQRISKDNQIPDFVRNFISSNENKLSEIVEYVLHNKQPHWEIDLTKHIQAPIPNLLGQIHLQELLNLRASLLFQESRITEAQNTLEASWRMNEHLLQRPEIISYLIGVVILRIQAGNLRQIPVPYDIWHHRINDSKILEQLWTVLEGDVWAMVKAAEEGVVLDREDSKKNSTINMILRPYIRLMVLDSSERILPFLSELKT